MIVLLAARHLLDHKALDRQELLDRTETHILRY